MAPSETKCTKACFISTYKMTCGETRCALVERIGNQELGEPTVNVAASNTTLLTNHHDLITQLDHILVILLVYFFHPILQQLQYYNTTDHVQD